MRSKNLLLRPISQPETNNRQSNQTKSYQRSPSHKLLPSGNSQKPIDLAKYRDENDQRQEIAGCILDSYWMDEEEVKHRGDES